MDGILTALGMWAVLLLLFRFTDKRTLASITTFDFVLLLVIGEATQQALLGEDYSLTMAAIVIATLIVLDRLADKAGTRWPLFNKVSQSVPVILVDHGELLRDRMNKTNIDEFDILESARLSQGIERMDQTSSPSWRSPARSR